jgi:hypothetical protein
MTMHVHGFRLARFTTKLQCSHLTTEAQIDLTRAPTVVLCRSKHSGLLKNLLHS